MYIFLPVLGRGQDKPAWTACPPGVKITMVGGKISRDSLPPGGKQTAVALPPRGQAVQGSKINWDTGLQNATFWYIVICIMLLIYTRGMI